MPSSVASRGHAALKQGAVDQDARSVGSGASAKSALGGLSSKASACAGDNDDETASVRSTHSSASGSRSTVSSSMSSSTTLSRSPSSGALRTSGSSLATSVVSLRDLETRKAEIEQELQRVQRELEERQTHERRSHAERPLAMLPATARSTTSGRLDKAASTPSEPRRPQAAPGSQHR